MRLQLALRMQILSLCLCLETRIDEGLLWLLKMSLMGVEVGWLLLAAALGLLLLMEMWIRVSLGVFNRGLRLIALEKPLH